MENAKKIIAPGCRRPLVDTHCHLDMEAYRDDLDGVLARAAQSNVGHIITIGIDPASSRSAVQLARKYPQVSATIGVHPHDADRLGPADLDDLAGIYEQFGEVIVGYGEIGLDYVKRYSSIDQQRRVFVQQLGLARELGLPVVVHNRDADDDTLEILRAAGPLPRGGVMHCFSGDLETARKVLDLGMLVSLPGVVTFKNSAAAREVAAQVPLSRLLIETDGPFLAPHPFRGKRNEPALLPYTAARVAEVRGVPIEEVARQTTSNAIELFNLNLTPQP